jgi:hypothetical protein
MNPHRASTFYPSCMLNLRLRFDEAFHIRGAAETPAPISVTGEMARAGRLPSAIATAIPLVLKGTGKNLSRVTGRMPKVAQFELPAYRQAGKFTAAFDFRDLPIDPRLVRACGVEIYLDGIAAESFAAGMAGAEADGSRRSIITPTKENNLLVGTVDRWSVKHHAKGSEVVLEGRDLRGLLLSTKIRPQLLSKIDLRKPIYYVVDQIISLHPFGSEISVDYNPDEWPDRIVPSPSAAGMTRVRMGANGQTPQSSPPGEVNTLNFWDVITYYCSLCGAVPYFVGETLRVRPARSILDLSNRAGFDPAIPTPFAGGRTREIEIDDQGRKDTLNIRRMVFGRDVDELSFERQYNAEATRVVEVVSLDTSSKKRGLGKLLIARWPKGGGAQPTAEDPVMDDAEGAEEAEVTSVAPSGQAAEKKIHRISIPGITDLKRLETIAQNIHTELGYGEMGGSCKTKNLTSFGGDATDPDLLRLRPGDAVEISIDARALSSRSPLVGEVFDQQRSSPEELMKRIGARLGDENLARVIVATARNQVMELQRFFRVANVKYSWSTTTGIEIQFDFQNYVQARFDVLPDQAATTSRPKTASSKNATKRPNPNAPVPQRPQHE